jgi:hypothetical protein
MQAIQAAVGENADGDSVSAVLIYRVADKGYLAGAIFRLPGNMRIA